jgi:hypothetical protein
MSDQKLLDLVEGNARVINEIYESVMTLRKAVAIVQTMLEEQLEDPEEQLKKVGLRHALQDSADIEPETTADNQTLSAPAGTKRS